MLNKIITALRQSAIELDGTGTFADGAFHMTAARQTSFDQNFGLRRSYRQDSVRARQVEQGVPLPA